MVILYNKEENASKGIVDFDLFQDNAFTRCGNNLIFKFSINDFALETQSDVFNGLSIHFCACFNKNSKQDNVLPSLAIARTCFTGLTDRLTSLKPKILEILFDKHIDMSALFHDIESQDLKDKLLNIWSFSIIPYGMGYIKFNPICFTLLPNGKVRAIIKFEKTSGIIIPCISYGMNLQLKYNTKNHIPNCISNLKCGVKNRREKTKNPLVATISSFSQLPYKFKQLYPYSWSSPCLH